MNADKHFVLSGFICVPRRPFVFSRVLRERRSPHGDPRFVGVSNAAVIDIARGDEHAVAEAQGLAWADAQSAVAPGVALEIVQAENVGGQQPVGSEEHTSELQSRQYLVCRLLLGT